MLLACVLSASAATTPPRFHRNIRLFFGPSFASSSLPSSPFSPSPMQSILLLCAILACLTGGLPGNNANNVQSVRTAMHKVDNAEYDGASTNYYESWIHTKYADDKFVIGCKTGSLIKKWYELGEKQRQTSRLSISMSTIGLNDAIEQEKSDTSDRSRTGKTLYLRIHPKMTLNLKRLVCKVCSCNSMHCFNDCNSKVITSRNANNNMWSNLIVNHRPTFVTAAQLASKDGILLATGSGQSSSSSSASYRTVKCVRKRCGFPAAQPYIEQWPADKFESPGSFAKPFLKWEKEEKKATNQDEESGATTDEQCEEFESSSLKNLVAFPVLKAYHGIALRCVWGAASSENRVTHRIILKSPHAASRIWFESFSSVSVAVNTMRNVSLTPPSQLVSRSRSKKRSSRRFPHSDHCILACMHDGFADDYLANARVIYAWHLVWRPSNRIARTTTTANPARTTTTATPTRTRNARQRLAIVLRRQSASELASRRSAPPSVDLSDWLEPVGEAGRQRPRSAGREDDGGGSKLSDWPAIRLRSQKSARDFLEFLRRNITQPEELRAKNAYNDDDDEKDDEINWQFECSLNMSWAMKTGFRVAGGQNFAVELSNSVRIDATDVSSLSASSKGSYWTISKASQISLAIGILALLALLLLLACFAIRRRNRDRLRRNADNAMGGGAAATQFDEHEARQQLAPPPSHAHAHHSNNQHNKGGGSAAFDNNSNNNFERQDFLEQTTRVTNC